MGDTQPNQKDENNWKSTFSQTKTTIPNKDLQDKFKIQA